MQTTTMAEKPPARTAICFEESVIISNYMAGETTESTSWNKNKTCNASLAERRAALETRTFARTETHIPTKPAIPEHKAPRRNEATVIYADVALCSHEIYKISTYHISVKLRFHIIAENHLPKPDASCCGVVVRKR